MRVCVYVWEKARSQGGVAFNVYQDPCVCVCVCVHVCMCAASGYQATGLVFGLRRGLQSRTPLFMRSWLDVRLFHNQPLWINFSVRPVLRWLFFFLTPLLVTYIEIIKASASLSIYTLHPTPVIKDQRGGPPLLAANTTTPHTHTHTTLTFNSQKLSEALPFCLY